MIARFARPTECITIHDRATTRTLASAAASAQLGGGSAGCHLVQAGPTMTDMAMVYRRPAGVMRQSVKPQLAS